MKRLLGLAVTALLTFASCTPALVQPVLHPGPSEGYAVDPLSNITKAEPFVDASGKTQAYNSLKVKVGGAGEISPATLYLVGATVQTGLGSGCNTLSETLQRCKIKSFKAPYAYTLPYYGHLEKAWAEYTRDPALDTSKDQYAPLLP